MQHLQFRPVNAGLARLAVLVVLALCSSLVMAMAGNLGTVTGMAAFRAGTFTGYDAVYLTGYRTAGDGGGGNFVRNGTACTDDGGAIVRDAAGNCFYRDTSAGNLSPVMFGAVCNNSADDHAALQSTENAAHNLGLAIAYPATNLCRTSVPITPGIGVDHFCPAGMNYGDSNSGVSKRCGVYGGVGSANYTFDLALPRGISSVQGPTFHDMYITSSGGCLRLNNPNNGFTDDATSQDYMAFARVIRVDCSNNLIGFQMSKCINCEVRDSMVNGTRIAIDMEGDENAVVDHNFIGNTTDLPIKLASHNTFGNNDIVTNNQINCPSADAAGIACLYTSARSARIERNYMECQGSYAVLPQAVKVDAGTINADFENNVIDCGPHFASHGLTLAGVPYVFTWRNNTSSGTPYASASFNGGTGIQYWHNQPYNVAQVYHSGNSNEGGFPFSSYNNFPEINTNAARNLAYYSPGSSTYIVGFSNYGASVLANGGAWQQPAAANGNMLDFNSTNDSWTGTLDICILAASRTAGQQVNLISRDGGAAINTTTFTLKNAPAWYCYPGHAYGRAATASVTNTDTAHHGSVSLYALAIQQP